MTATRVAGLLAATLALSACAGEKVWMRSGSGPRDAEVDEMDCAAEAENTGVSISVGGGAAPPIDRFSHRYACLRARGYKLVPLEAEEAAKLKSLGGLDREDYWRGLLVKRGFSPPRPAEAEPPAGPASAAPGPRPAPAQ